MPGAGAAAAFLVGGRRVLQSASPRRAGVPRPVVGSARRGTSAVTCLDLAVLFVQAEEIHIDPPRHRSWRRLSNVDQLSGAPLIGERLGRMLAPRRLNPAVRGVTCAEDTDS
ncbi:hypothetical protein JCM4814A_78770 [Streptomyces phaeofaciens JCM 4814]|uniref:Uncharacterized protein n=1 Tax=Streptomyces phaeofaciens TaxID=68254 RepID=A0A918HSR1_9ACTN|nr:hypothetical protein GCM10010226_87140 [Streptomyces phaeofaciens]